MGEDFCVNMEMIFCLSLQDILNHIVTDVEIFMGQVAAVAAKNTKKKKKKKKGKGSQMQTMWTDIELS